MPNRTILTLPLLAIACTSPSATHAPTRVAVLITTTTSKVKRGETPQLEVTLVNEGASPVTLVAPGDGSEFGWRTPIVAWQPTAPTDRTCGNTNPLTADEVFELRPGERRRVSGWIGKPRLDLQAPGRHEVSVTYTNEPGRTFEGLPLGVHDAEAMRRVRASTPVVAKSNVLVIEVVE